MGIDSKVVFLVDGIEVTGTVYNMECFPYEEKIYFILGEDNYNYKVFEHDLMGIK